MQYLPASTVNRSTPAILSQYTAADGKLQIKPPYLIRRLFMADFRFSLPFCAHGYDFAFQATS
jgi:hypothetical protein